MSGPKTSSYVVDAEAVRRAQQAARDAAELSDLRARYEAMRARASLAAAGYGDAVVVPAPLPADVTLAAARNAVARAQVATDATIAAARLDRINRVLTGAERRSSRVADAATAWRGEARKAVERIVARLDAQASPEHVEAVEEAVRAVDASTTAQASQAAVDLLRTRVQRATGEAALSRTKQAELARLRAELAGLEGDAVEEALALLAASSGGTDPVKDALREQVAHAVEAGRLLADRRYAAHIVRRELEQLGYEVGPGFETLVVEQGHADARLADWPGYAVRVRTFGDRRDLNFHVVRGPQSRVDQAAVDLAVERAWCRDHAALVEHAAEQGLRTKLERAVEAGARPVLVDRTLTPVAASAAAVRPRERERPING